jgi:hypothetical protein
MKNAADWAQDMKILIAYDGSDCADAALDDLQRAGLPADAEAQIVFSLARPASAIALKGLFSEVFQQR